MALNNGPKYSWDNPNPNPGDMNSGVGDGSTPNYVGTVPPPAQAPVPPPVGVTPRTTQPVGQAVYGATPGASSPYPASLGEWGNFNGNPEDPAAIKAYVSMLAGQQGVDPLISGQQDYLAGRIADTGGLTPGNEGYWQNRTLAGNWTRPEGPSSTQPSTADLMGVLNGIFGAGVPGAKTPSQTNPTLTSFLNGILSDPSSVFNKGLVNSEVMNARDQLEGQKNTQTQSLEAQLAQRGLAGSGAETTGLEELTSQLNNQFGNAVTSIYKNAGDQANNELSSVIAAATGLAPADANNLISQYEAATSRGVGTGNVLNQGQSTANSLLLGLGNLGLQSQGQSIGAQEFMDTFGLNQEQLANQIAQGNDSQLIDLLKTYLSGANSSAGGFQ